MTRWLVVLVTVALGGCGTLAVASPREIDEFSVTFTPSAPGPDAISGERATRAAREWVGATLQLPAVPDTVEFGMAACQEHEPQCMGPRGGPRPVWLIEWAPAPGRDHGTVIVDGLTGELLNAFFTSP